jgi:hypothetical protein
MKTKKKNSPEVEKTLAAGRAQAVKVEKIFKAEEQRRQAEERRPQEKVERRKRPPRRP